MDSELEVFSCSLAALDLLEQDESIEKIMLRGGWQTDSTAMKYLRNCIL